MEHVLHVEQGFVVERHVEHADAFVVELSHE
jgi:hypothetical protein